MTFDPGTPPDGRRDLPPPGTQLPPPGGQLSPPGPLLPPPGSQFSPAGAPPRQELPAWHHLPPEQLARLHQPGIVPLRPLYLGDIFGGALQTMRRNPSATIGTALVVLALLLVPSYLVSLVVTRATGLAEEDLAVLVSRDLARLVPEAATLDLAPGRLGYVHLVRGRATVNGHGLSAGDALMYRDEAQVRIEAGQDAEVLVFGLPELSGP